MKSKNDPRTSASFKGKPVPKASREKDYRSPTSKPRRSGPGGVGSGSGIPGPSWLGKGK